jgi:hypothetical protein
MMEEANFVLDYDDHEKQPVQKKWRDSFLSALWKQS